MGIFCGRLETLASLASEVSRSKATQEEMGFAMKQIILGVIFLMFSFSGTMTYLRLLPHQMLIG